MTDRRPYWSARRRRLRSRCREQCRAWRAAHPGAAAAHSAVARAIRSGLLTRPARCEYCGKRGKTRAHHFAGYGHPLLVSFICEGCHRTLERGK